MLTCACQCNPVKPRIISCNLLTFNYIKIGIKDAGGGILVIGRPNKFDRRD